MKKILLAFAVLALVGAGCTSQTSVSTPPVVEPTPTAPVATETSSFNFDFNYGVGTKNELNTFDGTFTKDMITVAPVTVPLVLDAEELSGIQQKIDELGIFPAALPGQNNIFSAPCISYDLLLESEGVRSQLEWNCDIHGRNEKLEALLEYLTPILESKDAYKNLPPAQGGYM